MVKKDNRHHVGPEGRSYQVVSGYQDEAQLRKSFNALTGKVFGFSLEDWYENGFWSDRYIPYSLLDGDTVVANVSVNIMDCLVFSKKRRYIQLGTVMTHEDYREQGLSRILMELVLEEWEDHCDLFYLYANDSVTSFYPKFGFREAQEHVYSKPFRKDSLKDVPVPRKIDVADAKDREFLYDTIAGSLPHSGVAIVDNPGMPMFHCMMDQRDNIHHFEAQNAIAIASREGDALVLHDIYCAHGFDMEEIVQSLADEKTRTLRLGFVPKDISGWDKEVRVEEDATFFVREGKGKLPEGIMFPEMSHA